MKLEIGSGKDPHPNYDIHIDIDIAHSPDVIADAVSLPFKNATFNEIRVVDVLEHISYRDTLIALTEWVRVMRTGAKIYIQVPEASVAIKLYQEGNLSFPSDIDQQPLVGLAWVLMGGQFDKEFIKNKESWRYNSHYALFDVSTLTWYLNQVGLIVEEMQINFHPNILCWAVKK